MFHIDMNAVYKRLFELRKQYDAGCLNYSSLTEMAKCERKGFLSAMREKTYTADYLTFEEQDVLYLVIRKVIYKRFCELSNLALLDRNHLEEQYRRILGYRKYTDN